MMNDFIRTHRKGVLIGLIIAGAVIIVASAILIGILLTKEYSVIGPWYNEGLRQQLRFVDEDSMIISTAAGINEAAYDFDKASGKGEISISGSTINFYIEGNSIFLVGQDGEAEYSKGELPVNVLATVTIEETTKDSIEETTILTTEATTATTTAATTVATETVAVTEPGATATPSPTPTLTPTPTPEPTPTPTAIPIFPSVTIKFDPFLPILGEPIIGTWVRIDNDNHYITFSIPSNLPCPFRNIIFTSTCTFNIFSSNFAIW